MMTSVYIVICVVLLLMTLGRVVFRAAPKGIDWALENGSFASISRRRSGRWRNNWLPAWLKSSA